MQEFFKNIKLSGFVIEVLNFPLLEKLKKEIIAFTKKTEEKGGRIYLFDPTRDQVRTWTGESVADVANYREITKINTEAALLFTMSVMQSWASNKEIFYISDQPTPSRHRRISRAICQDHEHNFKFNIMDIGNSPDLVLKDHQWSHPHVNYIHLNDINSTIFQEIIDEDRSKKPAKSKKRKVGNGKGTTKHSGS